MSPAQLEALRRHCRLGLGVIGVIFLLMFVRLSQRASSGQAAFAWLDDDLQLVIGIGAALVAIVVVGGQGLRAARSEPQPSWLRTDLALFAAVIGYGVGCGLFLTWCLEVWGEEEGGWALFLVSVLGILALLPERGVRPAGAILLGTIASGLTSLIRLNLGSRGSKSDEVIGCWILCLFLLPLAYLLLRGLLNVVKAEDHGTQPGAIEPITLELPVQVVARDGTYLVTLETPGLADSTGVETRIDGKTLHVVVPRPAGDPAEEVLLSTRLRGRFPISVALPRPLQDPPWSIEVARGLLTVQVAPIGDDG